MHAEDIWKPVERIAHLRRLLKKYHAKNPENLTATSSPVDESAPPLPIAAQSEAKVAPSTPALISFPARNRLPAHNCLSVRVSSTPTSNRYPLLQVCRSRRRQKLTPRS